MIELRPAQRVAGEIQVPGDKSLSHRALIFAALASGTSEIANLLDSADVRATRRILTKLGVRIRRKREWVTIEGLNGVLREPDTVLNCGNSGTSARLFSGVLAAQSFFSVLSGDASLRNRPMGRVVEPLCAMGAHIDGRQGNSRLPLAISGRKLRGAQHTLPVASAQVKTALLLAGLSADGITSVCEPAPSRDHTERFLEWLGAPIERTELQVSVQSSALPSFSFEVPGDFSSAAFFIALAALHPQARLRIQNVNLNPTRTGFLRVLENMGAEIAVAVNKEQPEPVGDLEIRSSELRNVPIQADEIPSMIDELPLWAVVATQAQGRFRLSGAEELRVKESDRIRAIVSQLRKMGARIEERVDGFEGEGPVALHGTDIQSLGDHRIAMALSVAALLAESPSRLFGEEWVAISFPAFFELLNGIVRY